MHLFCILGATASGKTALSIQLAQYAKQQYNIDIEIISLDSALVYQDMDIGTAKPTMQERCGIKHHLIDIIPPTHNYNVGEFLQDVDNITKIIKDKTNHSNKLFIIVGGTMLYHHALTHGLHDIPNQNLEIRQQINQEAELHGWQFMHNKLSQIDKSTADNIKPNDMQRIQRALEIYYTSGKPPSYFYNQHRESKYKLTNIALMPPRDLLHKKIEQRFNLMLEQGFINEVTNLIDKYPSLNLESNSIRCVGYRQAYEYIKNNITYQQFIDMGVASTRQLAKRQITWLRKTESYHIDSSLNNSFELLKIKFDEYYLS
ncbi:MAG: tRNA delta(2)-isopentenylpyrophosphate transferase [Pseudomonadota bacterium]|jgi:tRNA dimethylallyltransferase